MNKNFSFLFITGGVGFIGSNLVKFLLKKNYNLISIDNYFKGNKNNRIKSSRVKYINTAPPRDKVFTYSIIF
jgi:nucleoside-diphosphate-sugar epimerase